MPIKKKKQPQKKSHPQFNVDQCLRAICALYATMSSAHDDHHTDQIYNNADKWVSKLLSYPTSTQNMILSKIMEHPNALPEVWNLLNDLMGDASNQSMLISDLGDVLENELRLIPLILLADATQEHDNFLLDPSLINAIAKTFRQHGLVISGTTLCLPHALSTNAANLPYNVQRQALLETSKYCAKMRGETQPPFSGNQILTSDTVKYKPPGEDGDAVLVLRFIPVSLLWESESPDAWYDEATMEKWQAQVESLIAPHFEHAKVLEPLLYNDALVNGIRMFNVAALSVAISQAKEKVAALSYCFPDNDEGEIVISLHDQTTMDTVSRITLSRLPQRACSVDDINAYMFLFEQSDIDPWVYQADTCVH